MANSQFYAHQEQSRYVPTHVAGHAVQERQGYRFQGAAEQSNLITTQDCFRQLELDFESGVGVNQKHNIGIPRTNKY